MINSVALFLASLFFSSHPFVMPPNQPFDRIAGCESHWDWSANTGNGYYGGTQDNMQFWLEYDGNEFAPRPDLASRTDQIAVDMRARDGYFSLNLNQYEAPRGYRPWPNCGRFA